MKTKFIYNIEKIINDCADSENMALSLDKEKLVFLIQNLQVIKDIFSHIENEEIKKNVEFIEADLEAMISESVPLENYWRICDMIIEEQTRKLFGDYQNVINVK